MQGEGDLEVRQSSRSSRGRLGNRGKGRRSRRHSRWRQGNQRERETPKTNQPKRGRRSIGKAAQEVETTYNKETNEEIRRIIDVLEDRVLEEPSDPEMEEWSTLLLDPSNTRGRLTLYKQALHMYWVLKHLLAKVMEQVAIEMMEITHEEPEMKKEVANL